MPLPASSPLQRIKRHTLWLLLAFFVAVSYFATHNLAEKIEERDNVRMIRAWTETSIAFNRVVHELQMERGLSSGFIASNGDQFGHALVAQRALTDQAIARLTESTRNQPTAFALLADLSRNSLAELSSLPDMRSRVGAITLSRDVAVDRYTTLITQMFDHLVTTMSVGHVGWIVRQQMAFVFFLQAKEMAGQERALVTAMLSSGDYVPAQLSAYHRIKAVEQSSIGRFSQLADATANAGYQTIVDQPFIAEAERIRRLIVAVGASREPPPRMPDAAAWFDLATKKIDALSEFETVLSDRLLHSTRDIETSATRTLVIDALAVMLSVLFAGGLLLQIWRGKQLTERNLHLAAEVFDNSVESIIIADADSNIVEVNNAFTRISGYGREDVIGQNPRLFKSGRHDRKFYETLWEKLLRTGNWEGEIWNRRKDGGIYPALLSIVAVKDRKGALTHYIAMTVDLSKFKETEALLEQLRTFDPLTGLPNREAWHSAIDQAVADARRAGGSFAVLDIGLDRFKMINESFGHAVGDEVLVAAAENIKQALRRHDVAARPSGNHFAILLRDLDNPGDVGAYCEQLLAAFAQPIVVGEQNFSLSITIGIALFPTDGADTRALLQNAESALHTARDEDHTSYTYYSTEMNAAGAKLLTLEHMMRQALDRGEFAVVYQPQVDTRDGRLVGVEALIRWQNPELGMVSPVQFIPIAEATGLIVPIGEWVLQQSCRQARQWRQEFGADIPVAVNLSARQFRRDDLLATVQRALDDSGLPAALLELEITEGLLMNDPAGAAVIMRGLRNMGIKLALDDFGTGYSSLAYLKTFPLDRLKLDRAFVTGLADNRDDQAIANTVISLGHHLDMQVLAEGVETPAQRDFLLASGCDVFQGYLFGKPMAPAQLEENIRSGQLRL